MFKFSLTPDAVNRMKFKDISEDINDFTNQIKEYLKTKDIEIEILSYLDVHRLEVYDRYDILRRYDTSISGSQIIYFNSYEGLRDFLAKLILELQPKKFKE